MAKEIREGHEGSGKDGGGGSSRSPKRKNPSDATSPKIKSRTTESFRKKFKNLPADVRDQAVTTYHRWRINPATPGLRFKPLKISPGIYSIRIGLGWRALAVLEEDAWVWFWIGSHVDYDLQIGPS